MGSASEAFQSMNDLIDMSEDITLNLVGLDTTKEADEERIRVSDNKKVDTKKELHKRHAIELSLGYILSANFNIPKCKICLDSCS